MTEEPRLVQCRSCGALRSLTLAPECFCGKTDHKPAPSVPSAKADDQLWEPETHVHAWEPDEPVKWWNRERWWYGIVVRQEGERVLVRQMAKGDDRDLAPYLISENGHERWVSPPREFAGKVGYRPASTLRADE